MEIADNRDALRWEATIDDKVVGFAEYKLQPGRILFTHTETDEEYEGQGIASRLARAALDDAVSRDLRITLYCPFISAYVERHPEYLPSIDVREPRS